MFQTTKPSVSAQHGTAQGTAPTKQPLFQVLASFHTLRQAHVRRSRLGHTWQTWQPQGWHLCFGAGTTWAQGGWGATETMPSGND